MEQPLRQGGGTGGPPLPSGARRSPAPASETRRDLLLRRRNRGTPALSARRPRHTACSPDLDALRGFQIQLVARLHIESLVEAVDIANHRIATELRRRVRVGGQATDRLLVAGLGPPHLRPTVED